MRFDRLTPTHVRRAVKLYMEYAWPPERSEKPVFDQATLAVAHSMPEVLTFFDPNCLGEQPECEHFVLRLGNWRYPFMKLVLEEYLVKGEFFFSVDTHDDLHITPDMPDYEGWVEVRKFNRELKNEIEEAWQAADLPTYVKLRELMEGLAELETESKKRARLLIVDDERSVARGVAAALAARGYEVEVAFDGHEVVERLERDPLPDLVLLDFAMPGLDGKSVLEKLRAEARYERMLILLATASDIDLGAIRKSCGMLRKPYPREVLFAMIGQLLETRAE
jgi:CheY-like chemotaxis protein